MMYLIKPGTNFDFMSKRYLWIGISLVAVVSSIVLFFTKGLNYGIDFTGGAEIHLKVPADWDITRLREHLDKGGLDGLRVQQIGEAATNEYMVRAKTVKGEKADAKVAGTAEEFNLVSQRVQELMKTAFPEGGYQILKDDEVGPAAGSVLRLSGLKAMFFALLAIMIYVAVRFDARYAPGAVIALFHDAMIVLGIFIIMDKPFDLTILAALLALIGYSNNDTIIVFDRVRETMHMHPNLNIMEVVNRAVNETLGRTIMTSLTTFIVVFSLWWFGGPVLENFAFTLLVGIVVGSYSSIFVASSLVVELTQYNKKRQDRLKASGKIKNRKQYHVRPEPRLG